MLCELFAVAEIAFATPCCFVQGGAESQDAAKSDVAVVITLDALAEQVRAEADVPALGLMVQMRDGEPEIAAAGVRIAGTTVKITPGDAWHWGSVTKSMTATLAARLVEREVIAWDSTIADVLGDAVPEMHDAYRDVTLSHLLSHRAGLQPNIPMTQFGKFHRKVDDVIADRLEWVQIALNQEPVARPGVRYAYSNNGYIVAGAMLEAATGRPCEQLMRDELFEPLKMEGAGFGAPSAGEADKGPVRQPRGHVSRGGADSATGVNADNPPALGPAGRVHMPMAAIATYLRAHANRDETFLSTKSWEMLHRTSFGGNYAKGWAVVSATTRWHNGSNTMWYAEVMFDIRNGTVAAVAVNDGDTASVRPHVEKLLRELMKRGE